MKKSKKWMLGILLGSLIFCMSACGIGDDPGNENTEEPKAVDIPGLMPDFGEDTLEDDTLEEEILDESSTEEETVVPEDEFVVVIDAGHQGKGNSEKEPVGPSATEMKAKVTSGTSGCVTGLAEYELNLQVALKLEAELIERGYTVIMVRTEHDVNISNSERAQVANEANADAFIRIHANGSANPEANGAMTICQTENNIYNGHLYEKSKALSEYVLNEIVEETGCKREYVWETDTMSGINWALVPVTIVEMGYMSNPDEDRKLASEEYQLKIAKGIADGIDKYKEDMVNE